MVHLNMLGHVVVLNLPVKREKKIELNLCSIPK